MDFSPDTWRRLADAVLVLHFGIVLFVIGGTAAGLGCLLAGRPRFAARPAFMLVHASVLAIVVLQSWLGWLCPLTTWENRLRLLAGEAGYRQGFIADWLQRLLYYDAEPWAFTLIYTLFGLLTAGTWLALLRRHEHRSGNR